MKWAEFLTYNEGFLVICGNYLHKEAAELEKSYIWSNRKSR